MFCGKCGSQVPEGASSCPGCGAEIHSAAQTPAAQETKSIGRSKWLAPAIAVVAVILVIVLAVNLLSKGSSSNPMSALYNGIYVLTETKTAEVTVSVNGAKVSAAWVLGKDFASSTFTATAPYIRYIIHDGYVASNYGGDSDDPDNYYKHAISEMAEDAMDDAGFEFDYNAVIKNSAVNIDYLYEVVNAAIMESAGSYFPYSQLQVDKVVFLFEDFFENECKDDKTLNSFISDYSTSKDSGLRSYGFTLNIGDFIDAFSDFIDGTASTSSYMKKNKINDDTIDLVSYIVAAAQSQKLNQKLNISYSVDSDGVLSSLRVKGTFDGESINVKVTVATGKDVSIDTKALSALIKEIEEY